MLDCNHYVTAIGWGTTDAGLLFYIVKNSWGVYWGEDGYARIQASAIDNQEDIDERGVCGINYKGYRPYVL